MRVRLSIIALMFLGLAACGGGGPPAPAGLGYSVPNPGAVTYMAADTSYIEIDAMGQMMQMSTAQSATVNAVFADVAGAVQVIRVGALAGNKAEIFFAPNGGADTIISRHVVIPLL